MVAVGATVVLIWTAAFSGNGPVASWNLWGRTNVTAPWVLLGNQKATGAVTNSAEVPSLGPVAFYTVSAVNDAGETWAQ